MAYCFQDLVHRRVLKKQKFSTNVSVSVLRTNFLSKHISVGASTRFHLTVKTSFLRISVMILMQREGKRSERIKVKHFMNRSKRAKPNKYCTYVHTRHLSQLVSVR